MAHAAGQVGALGEFGMVYQALTPSDPEAEPYLAPAEELGIPVGVHTGCPALRTAVALDTAALGDPLPIRRNAL